MGLDMYLLRKTYVKNWDHYTPEKRTEVTVLKGGQPHPGIDLDKVRNIEEEVGYWRKANAIHQWFVDNVQDGIDDCGDHWVPPEKLQELLDLCKLVLATAKTEPGKMKAGIRYTKEGGQEQMWEDGLVITNPEEIHALLHTQGGFFFGSEEYDEWYLDGIRHSVEILEGALARPDGDYYYHSSW